jgi:multidrug efflux system membrane fusion protein
MNPRGRRKEPLDMMRVPRLLLAATAVLLPACGGGAARGSGRPAGMAVSVRTAPVAVQDVSYTIQALGSLEAEEMVQVTAEVEGAVAEVRFHEGDRVGPDTVLLRIDPERYRLEFQRAEASFKKAEADARRAEDEWRRREKLAAQQLVSEEEVNRARQEAERLGAEAAAAKAALDWAAANRRRSEVRAPRAGVINTRSVDTGRFVKNGDVLATLVDLSRLRLRFKLSEAESLRARVGNNVSFKVASIGARAFEARVYHVGEIADPATRQVEVLAWVRNPGVLKPGFFAEVAVATEQHPGALVVPEGAIQASEAGFIAYVVDQGKARQRPVQIGLRTGTGVVEILSGLSAGEQVVTQGSDRLADGVPVQGAGGEAKGGVGAAPSAGGRR